MQYHKMIIIIVTLSIEYFYAQKPFGIQDMRFLDLYVKDSNTIYILAVYFDTECATDFYSYTK